MPKSYAYVATCTKETSGRWGMEFQSLGNSVPPKVVQFPHLTQPLTQSPYFHSEQNPIAYFKYLVKGMPEMLCGYNTSILNRIQNRLNSLQVGDCCCVKVAYVDNGGTIRPYNYTIELIEAPNEFMDGSQRQSDLPSVLPSIDSPIPLAEEVDLMASRREERQEDLTSQIRVLNGEIRKLQADVSLVKKRLAETLQSPSAVSGDTHQPTENLEGQRPKSYRGSDGSDAFNEIDRSDELMLNREERIVIQRLIDHRVITKSQLEKKCDFHNPNDVIDGLIEKMVECNSPWISIRKARNGELVYVWNHPKI